MDKTIRNWIGLWKSLYKKIEKEINNNDYLKSLKTQIPKNIPKSILTEAITNYYYDIQTEQTIPIATMFEMYPLEIAGLVQEEWIENQEYLSEFYKAE